MLSKKLLRAHFISVLKMKAIMNENIYLYLSIFMLGQETFIRAHFLMRSKVIQPFLLQTPKTVETLMSRGRGASNKLNLT